MRILASLTGWLILASAWYATACNPYRVKPYQATGPAEAYQAEKNASTTSTEAPPSPLGLALATAKMQVDASYKALITFQETKATPADQEAAPKTTLQKDFVVTGSEVKLDLGGLPTGVSGLLTVAIAAVDGTPKFVAKRANTLLEANKLQVVVIDDCLVLPAPWDGEVHDGSCQWTIEDMD